MSDNPRPLSPYMFIYKWEITMVMSIVHRVTGIGLAIGTLVVAWWLAAAVEGDTALAPFYALFATWFGQFVAFCFVWALFHHMLSGVRHFVWDSGFGFSREMRFGLTWVALIGGFLAALIVFVLFVWM